MSVADKFKDNDNFKYDLVDILRQSITDKGNDLSGKIAEAYEKKDIKKFKVLSDNFLLAIESQDKLLATQKGFMVGNWIEQAKSLSAIEENRSLYICCQLSI